MLDAQGVPLPANASRSTKQKRLKQALEDVDLVESSMPNEGGTMLPSKLGKKLLKLVEEQQEGLVCNGFCLDALLL